MVINKFDHKLILFTNSEKFIANKFKSEKEESTKIEDIGFVIKSFDRYFKNSNIFNKDVFIIGRKEKLIFPAVKTNQMANLEGMGTYHAKYVFVGDVVNENNRKYSFFNAFDSGKSSDYLFDKIIKPLGIKISEIYVTNAYKKFNYDSNENDLSWEIDSINPVFVIVMGKNAEGLVKKTDFGLHTKFIFIPHPAFLSRFPSNITKFKITDLINEIR